MINEHTVKVSDHSSSKALSFQIAQRSWPHLGVLTVLTSLRQKTVINGKLKSSNVSNMTTLGKGAKTRYSSKWLQSTGNLFVKFWRFYKLDTYLPFNSPRNDSKLIFKFTKFSQQNGDEINKSSKERNENLTFLN